MCNNLAFFVESNGFVNKVTFFYRFFKCFIVVQRSHPHGALVPLGWDLNTGFSANFFCSPPPLEVRYQKDKL